MASYWQQYPSLDRQLRSVRALIDQRAQIANPDIAHAIVAMNAAGGKYLRPALFLLCTNFGEQPRVSDNDLLKIAASLETLHMATLVHDDIIDDSPLRRGAISVQSQFGKDVAVYTGDLLFTVFFELVIETMNGSKFMSINAQAMKRILMGELDQMQLRFHQHQQVSDYIQSCSGKTAELFRLACEEGAYFGGGDESTVARAERIGYHIGLAFQILDDILDYTADSKALHKPVLEDLATGVYTLPLLAALEHHADAFAPYLDKQRAMTPHDVQIVAQLVREYGGVERAQALARDYTQQAIDDIQQLPHNTSRNILLTVTQQLLHRTR